MARGSTILLAANVAGWSRLVLRDEAAAVAAHHGHRAALIDPLAEMHGGQVADAAGAAGAAGGGLLIEFPDVVAALRCALAWQHGMHARNAEAPTDRRLDYRIGLHVAAAANADEAPPVDGVNLAAKIAKLGPPGGVWTSRAVVEAAAGQGAFAFSPQKAGRATTVDAPPEVFELRDGREAATTPQPRRRPAFIGLGGALAAVAGVAAWLLVPPDAPPLPPLQEETASEAAMALPLPDRPSLVVLPFRDFSQGEAARGLADGLTEDLIDDLSKISGLFVIARNTSFAFRDGSSGAAAVSEALGVRHVLQGSLRRASGRLQVNVRLVDAVGGGAAWADRFEGDATDVFALQDRIALRVVEALAPASTEGKRTRPAADGGGATNLPARAAFQEGWEAFSRFNLEDNAAAVPHFRRAVALDPAFGRAWGALALAYMRAAAFGWSGPLGESEATLYRELAPQALAQARAQGASLAPVVEALRQLNYRHGREPEKRNRGLQDARREAEQALFLAPSDPEGHLMMAWTLIAAGDAEAGLRYVEAARRLDPRGPGSHALFAGAAHFALGELEKAAAVLEARLAEDPRAWELAPLAAAVQARLGRRAAAPETLRRWRPDLSDAGRRVALGRYLFPVRWIGEAAHLNADLQDAMRLAAEPASVTVESLLERLAEAGPDGQVDAIRRLGWFGPAAAPATGALSAALGAEDRRVSREAAVTLGKIGPAAAGAVPQLEAMADRPIIGFRAREALALIQGAPGD